MGCFSNSSSKNLVVTVRILYDYLSLLDSSQTVLHLHGFNHTDLLTFCNLHTHTNDKTGYILVTYSGKSQNENNMMA